MSLYLVRVASGHDWLVEAESAEEALADWPEDAEEASDADVPTCRDVLFAQESGDSDVDDDTAREWVLAHAVWVYDHCPTTHDDSAVGAELCGDDGEKLAACLWAGGEMDITSDGCGVFADILGADDIDWPDEDTARAAVFGEEGEERRVLLVLEKDAAAQ